MFGWWWSCEFGGNGTHNNEGAVDNDIPTSANKGAHASTIGFNGFFAIPMNKPPKSFFHYALSLYPSSSMTMRAQQILEAHAHVVFRLCACHNLCHVFFSFHSLLPLIIVTTSSPSSLPLTTPQPIFLSSNFHFIHLLFFFFSH